MTATRDLDTGPPAARVGRPTRASPTALAAGARGIVPGLVLAVVTAVAATPLGLALPVVGAPVFGVVLGMVVGVAIAPGQRLHAGLAFASGPVLQGSIIVLGATLSLTQVVTVGLGSLPVMLGTLAVALVGAWLVGGLLGVRGDTRTLIGVGTAICGASAIAAASAVLKPKGIHVAYAIGTIFTFNVVAVLTFPAIGHLLGMAPESFGIWAGTAINDTSSVVAAGYSYSPDAGPYALVIKLTRSLAIVPVVMVLALVKARRDARKATGQKGAGLRLRALPWTKIVPLFLVGFVAASALDTVGAVPAAWHPALGAVGTFMITTALAGIGLTLDLRQLRATGPRPLLLGAVLWILVAASSIGLQALTGTL